MFLIRKILLRMFILIIFIIKMILLYKNILLEILKEIFIYFKLFKKYYLKY